MSPGDGKKLVASLLRQILERGCRVEIEGLGTFLPRNGNGFRFIPQTRARVFVGYVEEDLEHALRLCDRFVEAGFDPWLDKMKLLPGQNWPRAIETAIQLADFFVACFSRRSVSKRGSFHCELRYALECAARVPLDEIFLIPLRIEECTVPARITRHIQYVDLFPDFEAGFTRVLKTIAEQQQNRKRKQLLLAG